ncbi:hypothetical protein [Actinoalloteichus hymeniacidonis]|uniref:Uncharacterized protein n=1 Tax=Actinoalloteichus hymeniacidonis TaxID=340345 RepID=A0AAC9HMA7_9PSEU|nr:hypothetical protein [Actinoalloteichus hymeniacidonis]AOS61957.1 hypothetical protein TL08_05660 [Actinoalloteichus hymeniacidonis]MBB5910021.1 hypothetical protein [Actinoalloteichus hymeniacidonis]
MKPTVSMEQASGRWPTIRRYLLAKPRIAKITNPFLDWHCANASTTLPNEQIADALTEWADYFEWDLQQRTDELVADPARQHFLENWTDSMAYCCRRWAAWARGEDPGKPIPLHERRPDLARRGNAITDEIIAGLAVRSHTDDWQGTTP